MTKRKKQKRTLQTTQASGFGAKNLIPELHKAEALMGREQWQEALRVLTDLNRTNPNQPRVLDALLSVYYELKDFLLYQRTCEQFLSLEPNNANVNYLLAGVYVTNMYSLLAFQAFQHCLEKWPDHEQADIARDLVAELKLLRDAHLEEMQLSGPDGFELAVLHEQAQAHLEGGEFDLSRQAEETLLQKRPDFLPARNNLSLVAFLEGDLEGAITICHQVLETDVDNVHALSNLVRYQCAAGQLEAATDTSERLQDSQAAAAEGWAKRAEALACLGNDAGILQLYEQAQQTEDWHETTENPMFLHLVAVALARTGHTQLARQKWQLVLQQNPQFSLARENLDDLNQPLGQQQGAWPFDFPYWVPKTVLEGIDEAIPNVTNQQGGEVKAAVQKYLKAHPRLLAILPILLDRGDPEGRAYTINLAIVLNTPELHALLKDLALGQRGTDSMRINVARTLAQEGVLPFGEPIQLWLQGKWGEINLMAYEVHNEPSSRHTPKVEKLLIKGNRLMKSEEQDDIQAAERLFKQAIKVEPEAPDILNNLAGTYFLQERESEAISLWTEITERFPDYVFARATLAQIQLRKKNIEAAEQLLHPILSKQRFHFDEFTNFSRAQIMVLIAKNEFKEAKSWLNMWVSMDPEHPEVKELQHRLERHQRFVTNKLGQSS